MSKMAESVIDKEWPLPFNAARSNPMSDCPQQDQKREHPEMAINPPQLEGRCNYATEIENLDMQMNTIVHHVADMGEFDNIKLLLRGITPKCLERMVTMERAHHGRIP
jgi:hypothetical protein